MESLQYILKPKSWSSGSKMFLVYTLMKVDNRVSFISIAFAVVKLKMSKFCLAIQHPWNGSSRELFGSLLPQIWSNFVKILTRGSTLANRNIVWKFFEAFKKNDGPKIWPFDPTLTPRSPWKWSKSKTIGCGEENLQPLSCPNMSKLMLYISSPLSGKNTITFCTIQGIFVKKHSRVTS